MIQNKRGVSGIIVVIILIGLVLATSLIVWGVVRNIVEKGLGGVESCFGVFGKITINNEYTCYNSSSKEFRFSLNIGDIDVDEVLVSISGEGTTKSLKITDEEKTISNLTNYPDHSTNIKLPGKNSGLTYIFNMSGGGFAGKPDSLKIAPNIKGEQCEITDSLFEIDNCFALV